MSRCILGFAALMIGAWAGSAMDLVQPGNESSPGATHRDAFYCQAPDYTQIYNMSSGFDAEIADDIPVAWTGYSVETLTLWVGEWFSMGGPQWRDPVGVRANLYHESCPPEITPFRTVEVAWDDLDKQLVYSSGGSIVYEVHIPLSPALIITPGMSLGATALIDWGHDEPFTGICATPMYVTYGACVAYLDATWWGYERWTPINYYTTIDQDLGFCLSGREPASVESIPTATVSLTAQPNPFNPRTTLSYRLDVIGHTRLSVHDITGRCVGLLVDGLQTAGDHRVDWQAESLRGRPLPAGVYIVRLETTRRCETAMIVLLD